MGLEEWLEEKYELTEEHFEVFKNEFMYWVDELGMKGWEFIFKLIELTDARAQCMPGQRGRVVVVCLNTVWEGQEVTEYELRRTGYHEALELFLSKMTHLAQERSVTDAEIEEETHNLIRTLENAMWEKSFAERCPKSPLPKKSPKRKK